MSSFQFKQFTIHQDQCAMKVGTDGVLLGAWVSLPNNGDILDIGTGTGIISLMIAQRLSDNNSYNNIIGIDIDEGAAKQAQDNFLISPWKEHLRAYHQSLSQFSRISDNSAIKKDEGNKSEVNKFSLIVSNPPFYNATLKPDDPNRALARHKDALPVEEIAHYAVEHLSKDGRLALIYPTAYDSEVMTAMVLNHLHPTRICDIFTKLGKPAKRRMVEFSLSASTIIASYLAIRDENGVYTDEYRRLTEAFYLHLLD